MCLVNIQPVHLLKIQPVWTDLSTAATMTCGKCAWSIFNRYTCSKFNRYGQPMAVGLAWCVCAKAGVSGRPRLRALMLQIIGWGEQSEPQRTGAKGWRQRWGLLRSPQPIWYMTDCGFACSTIYRPFIPLLPYGVSILDPSWGHGYPILVKNSGRGTPSKLTPNSCVQNCSALI